jgi:hypothetical protein
VANDIEEIDHLLNAPPRVARSFAHKIDQPG